MRLFTWVLLIVSLICLTSFAELKEVDKQQMFVNNIVKNGGFEGGKSYWSASIAGSFTINTTASNVAVGLNSAAFAPSTAGNYFISSAFSIPSGLTNRQAALSMMVKGCSPSVSAIILDSSDNVIVNQALSTYTDFTKIDIPFPVGASTSVRLKLLTNTTVSGNSCYLDDITIGDAFKMNLSNVSQAYEFATTTWSGGSCAWSGTASASLTSFTAATCTKSVTGNASTPASDIPSITLTNGKAGSYLFVLSGGYIISSSPAAIRDIRSSFDWYDGATSYQIAEYMGRYEQSNLTANVNSGYYLPSVSIGIASAFSSKTFQIRYQGRTSDVTTGINGNSTPFKISVYYFPSSSQVAMTPEMTDSAAQLTWETSDFSASGSIGPLLNAAVTTYASRIGNPTAYSGSLAGTFYNVKPGKYYAGISGGLRSGTADNLCGFYLMVDGVAKAFNYAIRGTYAPTVSLQTMLEITSFKTSMKIEVQAAVVVGSGTCTTTSGSGYPLNMYLIPVSNSLPMPMLMNNVSTPASGGVNVVSARGTTIGATASISAQDGTWISSIIKSGTGSASISFAAGIFSAAPRCSLTAEQAGPLVISVEKVTTTLTNAIITMWRYDGAAGDDIFSITCTGSK